MGKFVELAFRARKIVGVQLADLQADDSTWETSRRFVLGGAGLTEFYSGSARTLWFDTSGVYR